jgi:rhodanese-related sulfurtransferase
MPAPNMISAEKLNRLIGTPHAPLLIDVVTDEDFEENPAHLPGSIRHAHTDVANWGKALSGQSVVVVCNKGLKLSQGTAAWLRQLGASAQVLEGGRLGWQEAKLPMIPAKAVPRRNAEGKTVWVTRARPKIDRIACPWLIRRFVDPDAVILFVAPSEVTAVAERFDATPFDIEDTFWSHRGELCTFDVMLQEWNLATEPLLHLATIVRGADTARPDLAPEVPGLLAASLGLSRMFADDLEQLEADMILYDAFYRWCRDATEETHNWPSSKP